MFGKRVEHSIGLACPSHPINEYCGVVSGQGIVDGLQHGLFEYLPVACFLSKYFLVLIHSFSFARKVWRLDFHLLAAGNAQCRLGGGRGVWEWLNTEVCFEVFMAGRLILSAMGQLSGFGCAC